MEERDWETIIDETQQCRHGSLSTMTTDEVIRWVEATALLTEIRHWWQK